MIFIYLQDEHSVISTAPCLKFCEICNFNDICIFTEWAVSDLYSMLFEILWNMC